MTETNDRPGETEATDNSADQASATEDTSQGYVSAGFTRFPRRMFGKYRSNVCAVWLAAHSFPADSPLANRVIAAKAGVGHNVVDRAKRALIAGGDLEGTYSLEAGAPARHRFPRADERPFTPVPNWLWSYGLEPGELMLWVALRHFKDLPYGIVPGVRELATMTKIRMASIAEHRRVLVDKGLIRIEKRGPGQSDRYILLRDVEKASTSIVSGEVRGQSSVETVSTSIASEAMRVETSSTSGASEAMRGCFRSDAGCFPSDAGCFPSDADNRMNIQTDSQTENQTDAQPSGFASRCGDKRIDSQEVSQGLKASGKRVTGPGNHPGEKLADPGKKSEETSQPDRGEEKQGSAIVSQAKEIPMSPLPTPNPAIDDVRSSVAQRLENRVQSQPVEPSPSTPPKLPDGHTMCAWCGIEEAYGAVSGQPIGPSCHTLGKDKAPTHTNH